MIILDRQARIITRVHAERSTHQLLADRWRSIEWKSIWAGFMALAGVTVAAGYF